MVFSAGLGSVLADNVDIEEPIQALEEVNYEIKDDENIPGNKVVMFEAVSEEEDAEIQADVEAAKDVNFGIQKDMGVLFNEPQLIDFESYRTNFNVNVSINSRYPGGFDFDRFFPDGMEFKIFSLDENFQLVEEQEGVFTGTGDYVLPKQMRVYSNAGEKLTFGFSYPEHVDLLPVIETFESTGNYNDGTKEYYINLSFGHLVNSSMKTEWHSSKAPGTFPNLKGIFNPGSRDYEFNLYNDRATILRNDNGDQRIIDTIDLSATQIPDHVFGLGVVGSQDGKIKDNDGTEYFVETVYDRLEGGLFIFHEVKTLSLDAGNGTVTPDKIEVAYTKAGGELPTPTPPEGQTFSRWKYEDGTTYDPTKAVMEDLTIIAEYIGDVIGPVNPSDPTDPTKPDDYVTVTYKGGEHGTVDPKNTYYVNPVKNIKFGDLVAPKITPETGYKHIGWDVEDSLIIKADVIATAQYSKQDDVIGPFDPDNPPEKPDGYVQLTYQPGENGTLEKEVSSYFINPKANITFGSLEAPKVNANVGYKFTGWDVAADTVIKVNTIATAQYEAYENIIGPFDPEGPNVPEKPEGYATVTFDAGEHGTIAAENTYYVNPTKNIVFGDLTAPEVTANVGYKHIGWDVDADFIITKDLTATAQYEAQPDVVGPVDPNDPTEPEKPYGYVVVTYLGGDHGTVAAQNTYYVNPTKNITFGSLTAPELTIEKGYEFTNWDVKDSLVITEDVTATAQYRESEFNHDKVVKMEIITPPDKTVYFEEEFFDPTGMVVRLTDENGKTKDVPYDEFNDNYLSVPTDKELTTDDVKVTVTYDNGTIQLTADQPITVKPIPLSAKPINLEQVYVNEEQKITGSFEEGVRPDPATSEIILLDVNNNPIKGSDGNPVSGTIKPDGTFEFPIDELSHGQVVKVQLTEKDKKPTISDEQLTIDKLGPVVDQVKATPSEDFIDLKARVEEKDATVVVKVGDVVIPSTVDSEGNIQVTIPKNIEGDIVIEAMDPLGNKTIVKVDDPAYSQLAVTLRGKKPYAGNYLFTVIGPDNYKAVVNHVRNGEVIQTLSDTLSVGRASFYFDNQLEVGDIIQLQGFFGNLQSEPVNYRIDR